MVLQTVGHGSIEHQFMPWLLGANGGQWQAVSWKSTHGERQATQSKSVVLYLSSSLNSLLKGVQPCSTLQTSLSNCVCVTFSLNSLKRTQSDH